MFLHIFLLIFSITDASEMSFSVPLVDTINPCQRVLAPTPNKLDEFTKGASAEVAYAYGNGVEIELDAFMKGASAKEIIAKFRGSRRHFNIDDYSYLEELLALKLVKVLGGNVGLVSRKLGIYFPTLYNWVILYEFDNGVRIRSLEVTDADKDYAVWLAERYDGNIGAVSRELRTKEETIKRWIKEYKEKKAQNKSPRIVRAYTYLEKARAIRKVIEHGGNINKASNELNIPPSTLRNWVIKYEIENDVQILKPRVVKIYTDEKKTYVIRKVIEYEGNISQVARELNIPATTVRHWVLLYEEEHGVQIRNNNKTRVIKNYTKEMVAIAIDKLKELEGNVSLGSRELNIPRATLHSWIIKYEEEHDVQIRNPRVGVLKTFSDEEKSRAIDRVKELGGNVYATSKEFGVSHVTLRKWVMRYEEENGVQIRNIRPSRKVEGLQISGS